MEKIRYAIYGFGLFGEGSILPAFEKCKHSELIAITKRNFEQAKNKASQYNIPYYYSNENWDSILNNDQIDAIFIATPNSTHMKDTIKCLEAGKDVIVEKPMAMNAEECRKMIEVSEKTGRKLMIAHCMRYCTSIEYINKIIKEDKLGDLVSISAEFISTGRESKRSWKYDKNLAGGGASFDLGVHMIDTVRFLANSTIEKEYFVRRPSNLKKEEVDEYSTFLMDFSNGVVGKATASFWGPRHSLIEVYGKKGYVRAVDFNKTSGEQKIEIDLGNGIKTISIENEDFYTKEIDAFSLAILNNDKIPISGKEGLINQKLIDKINIF